jgi:D-sedoheptulose 7-phosphate isomerase
MMIDAILRKVRESTDLETRFFEVHAPAIEGCARKLAERFAAGGRLFAMGNGGSACDAQHVAVEFQHPVVEKRPALPALALVTDAARLTTVGNDTDFCLPFTAQLALHARASDAVLGLSTSGSSANVNRALAAARRRGLYTIGFAGSGGGAMVDVCDVCLVVPSRSIHRIQEVHVTLLHVLWDLVHVARGEDDVL